MAVPWFCRLRRSIAAIAKPPAADKVILSRWLPNRVINWAAYACALRKYFRIRPNRASIRLTSPRLGEMLELPGSIPQFGSGKAALDESEGSQENGFSQDIGLPDPIQREADHWVVSCCAPFTIEGLMPCGWFPA
jgi:hypothetical protein